MWNKRILSICFPSFPTVFLKVGHMFIVREKQIKKMLLNKNEKHQSDEILLPNLLLNTYNREQDSSQGIKSIRAKCSCIQKLDNDDWFLLDKQVSVTHYIYLRYLLFLYQLCYNLILNNCLNQNLS